MYACLEACVMFRIALGKEEVSFNHRWLLRWNKFLGRERNPKNSVHKEQWQVICLSVQNLHQDWLCILISYYASLSHPYSQFAHLLNGESSVNLIGLLWKSDHPCVAQCLSSCIKYSINISWHSSSSSTLPEVNSEFLGYLIKYPSFLFIASQYSGDSSFLECDPLHLTLCLPSQIPTQSQGPAQRWFFSGWHPNHHSLQGWLSSLNFSNGHEQSMEHQLVVSSVVGFLLNYVCRYMGFPGESVVKQTRLPMQEMLETQVWSLGGEDSLEEEMATHSSILAWRIPWTGEPGRLQSMGSQRVGHDWVTEHSTCSYMLCYTTH